VARRRFFVDAVRQGRAELHGDDARHLRQVLRAEIGQRYELSDDGSVYLAEIEAVGRDAIVFRILEKLTEERPPVHITLFLALIKFDRFEWAIEKATEFGVAAVVPVRTERSEKGLESGAVKRLERWRRIARESSQQARRARLPGIGRPVDFIQAVAEPADHRWFVDEQPGAPALLAALPDAHAASDRLALLVGPEGGWTDGERELALARGWTPVSLGPLILRAETAALAAVSVLGNAWYAGRRA
jgi:16S rRNA (uracil1498-N3)-methyltransferase